MITNKSQYSYRPPYLPQQHYDNFRDRFANWPISIEVLSRFKTAKQQTEIIKQVESGQIDILIGTHKLLQNSIKYKDLGLLVVDEEHRFGVKQKEKKLNNCAVMSTFLP